MTWDDWKLEAKANGYRIRELFHTGSGAYEAIEQPPFEDRRGMWSESEGGRGYVEHKPK